MEQNPKVTGPLFGNYNNVPNTDLPELSESVKINMLRTIQKVMDYKKDKFYYYSMFYDMLRVNTIYLIIFITLSYYHVFFALFLTTMLVGVLYILEKVCVFHLRKTFASEFENQFNNSQYDSNENYIRTGIYPDSYSAPVPINTQAQQPQQSNQYYPKPPTGAKNSIPLEHQQPIRIPKQYNPGASDPYSF